MTIAKKNDLKIAESYSKQFFKNKQKIHAARGSISEQKSPEALTH